MKKTLFFLSMATLVAANPFETTLKEEVSWLEDETFVISASKVKEEIKKTTASVFVIDEDTINQTGAQTLFEALRVVPGLGVSQSNIYVNKINARGIETLFSEKVLILLDGHSLNSDLLDGGATTPYSNFPLNHVKRIEVIKGPASALYGENAFTALINIITKEAKEIKGTQVSAVLGSNNTHIANVLFGKTYENFDLVFDLNYRDTDGAEMFVAHDAINRSGYTHPFSKRLYTNLSIKHESGFYIKANYNHAQDGPHYGVVFILNDEDKSTRDAWFLEMGYQHKINDAFTISARAYRDFFQYDNKWRVMPQGAPSAEYPEGMLGYVGLDNIKSGIETLITYSQNNMTLVSGVSYELQQIQNPWQKMNWNPVTGMPVSNMQDFSDPNTNYISENSREFFALYTEILYDLTKDLRLNAGMRYDHYSDFGGVFNPRIGAAWQLTEHNNLKLMYSEAFRAPTFSELYNINNPVSLGNPNLNPERVKTLELSFQNSSVENLEMSLTLFNSLINDIIIVSNYTHVNEGETSTKGFEATLKQNLYRGSYIVANYTYQNPENTKTSQTLPDIAKQLGYLALNYRVNRQLNLYIDAKYTGEQTRSDNDDRSKIDSSIINNVSLLIKDLFLKELQTKIFIYNVFNQNHFNSHTPYDYPLADRSYGVELSYKF